MLFLCRLEINLMNCVYSWDCRHCCKHYLLNQSTFYFKGTVA